MANNIIFTDGFDHYTTLLDKWDAVLAVGLGIGGAVFTVPSVVPGSGRGGAGAVLCGPSGSGGTGSSMILKNVGAQSTIYLGFALNWNPAGQASDTMLASFLDSSSAQVSLWLTASGIFYFMRGQTTAALGAHTTVSFPANSFHYVEVQVTISSTVGVCVLKIDQATVLNITGVNTQATTNTTLSSIKIGADTTPLSGAGSTYICYIDDVYIDTLGFNGDNRINGQLPSGNGTTQNFSNVEAAWVAATVTTVGTTIIDSNSNLQRCVAVTGDAKTGVSTAPTWATTIGVNTTDNHVTWSCLGAVSQYKLVNETNPDGDSSYISSSTVGDISRFTFPTIPIGASVKSVIIWVNGRKDDGGYRALRGAIKSGATLGDTGVDSPLGGNYQYQAMISATDPATGVAWTASGVNAAEFGVKLTA